MSQESWSIIGAGVVAGMTIAVFAWPTPVSVPHTAPLALLGVGLAMAIAARLRYRRKGPR
jgi:hypothetical protein